MSTPGVGRERMYDRRLRGYAAIGYVIEQDKSSAQPGVLAVP
jgi:hypothetical protein